MAPNHLYLSDFHTILPEYICSQEYGLKWLEKAHLFSAQGSTEIREAISRTIEKVCCKPSYIGQRGSALADFTHTDWEQMTLYPLQDLPLGHGMGRRSEVYKQIVDTLFMEFYPSKEEEPPADLIHVTCTGYNCPSGAQTRVANLGWEKSTSVTHAYHMGCMGAIKAIRMGCGFSRNSEARTDIVHTEICTLHLNPSLHTAEQLVGESLFADGFVKYSIKNSSQERAFLVEAFLDEMIPNSEKLMRWECKDWGFQMTLSKEIPVYITRAVKTFIERLDALRIKKECGARQPPLFAIHPGGPKIIDQIAKTLELKEEQIAATKKVFFERGNMSSSTLPHIWEAILNDDKIEKGREIISLAFGPGLTICGLLLSVT